MEQLKKCIGLNLYNYRNKAGLTLQQLSELTKVSKTMLSGIEKAEMNPSITTLWKIADGLKIPISWLMNEKKREITLVRNHDCTPTITETGYCIKTIFPFDPQKHIEVYVKEIEESHIIHSDGHREGIMEYLMIHEGTLEINIADTIYQLYEGDSIRFAADVEHSYKNIGKGSVKAYTIIYYPEKDMIEIT
ncbi:helix-turn-helix domain-containing protein [Acidaminobacter sp. JC074]|uniref:helix-turn-helix domain-containing protein n=1 Tax=Acidaminobacter sp. JC074 TaxID=2530199 RepID=UPI001F10D810|nr:XRE family transcriptional regulator [Acidaminobacter sp. JC074]MCH4889109.1 helix-turn-helix domain-containing protein [Acidaminobacter sp. JC074]